MRFYLKFAPLLTFIFAALVGFIHARPYDGSQLQAILVPSDGCALPCFMGIRPGVTTRQEAVAILQAHPWVAQTNLESDQLSITSAVTWDWSGLQPAFINAASGGELRTAGNMVTAIYVSLAIPFGDFLLWRQPEQAAVYCRYQFAGARSSVLTVLAYYENDLGVAVNAPARAPICRSRGGNCIQTVQSFLTQDARLTLGDNFGVLVDYAQLARNLRCGYER